MWLLKWSQNETGQWQVSKVDLRACEEFFRYHLRKRGLLVKQQITMLYSKHYEAILWKVTKMYTKKLTKWVCLFDTDYSKLLEFTHETNKFPFCDNKDEFSWINVGQIWNGQYKLTHNTQVMAFSFYSVIEEALYALHFTQVNTSY